jgi:hypothetical protein
MRRVLSRIQGMTDDVDHDPEHLQSGEAEEQQKDA